MTKRPAPTDEAPSSTKPLSSSSSSSDSHEEDGIRVWPVEFRSNWWERDVSSTYPFPELRPPAGLLSGDDAFVRHAAALVRAQAQAQQQPRDMMADKEKEKRPAVQQQEEDKKEETTKKIPEFDEHNQRPQTRTSQSSASSSSSSSSISWSPREERKEEMESSPQSIDKSHKHQSSSNANTPASTQPPGLQRSPVVCPLWTRWTEGLLHGTIRKVVVTLAVWSAQHPYWVIGSTLLLSIGLAAIGFFTNSQVVFDHEDIFTPMNTRPYRHGQWLDHTANFLESDDMVLILHAHGETVLTQDAVRRAMQAIDVVRTTPGWDDLCAQSQFRDPLTDEPACWIWSATQYWNHNVTLLDEQVQSDDEIRLALSESQFPNTGIPIFHELLLGKPEFVTATTTTDTSSTKTTTAMSQFASGSLAQAQNHSSWYQQQNWWYTRNNSEVGIQSSNQQQQEQNWWYTRNNSEVGMSLQSNNQQQQQQTTHPPESAPPPQLLTFAPVFMISMGLPNVWPETTAFQTLALDRLYALQQEWKQQDSLPKMPYRLEFFCHTAYDLEYERALNGDMPLVPVIFCIMLAFTCFVFHSEGGGIRSGPCAATSRFPIGIAAIATIVASILAGFGLMWCIGIPFTNMTLLSPFIILGVGLDDVFIITGAYFRRVSAKQARDRQRAVAAKQPTQQSLTQKDSEEHRGNHEMQNDNKLFQLQPFDEPFDVEEPRQQSADGHQQHPYDEVSLSDDVQQQPNADKIPISQTTTSERGNEEQLAIAASKALVVEYIRDTMEEVGLSISLTTVTTTVAFVLGSMSSIPGIQWLCLYASVTIVFDFFFQITFFVALLSLDERRIARVQRNEAREIQEQEQQKDTAATPAKRSCCGPSVGSNSDSSAESLPGRSKFFIDRFMRWYAKQIIRPGVRTAVLAAFTIFFGICIWSTTQLTQEFNVEDYVPEDSYIRPFFTAMDQWTAMVVSIGIYFRNVDQADPAVQKQMREFINDITALPQVGKPPDFCWVTDLDAFLNGGDVAHVDDEYAEQASILSSELNQLNFTFEEKLDIVLKVPAIREVYGGDFVRDEAGHITASKCYINIRNLDLNDVREQIEMLEAVYAVSEAQPINAISDESGKDWPFFTFHSLYYYWELYKVSVNELVLSTIAGVIAVCFIGFVMIPHRSAILFLGPGIIILYFDLLGVMQFAGIHINAVTYVTVVISIGLLVDFLMHILLRYYETPGTTREAKVIGTLETMGSSMMLGGLTTLLGVVPLVFSTTKIFMTVFVAFFAMVTLGILVGLVLLPVVLSLVGPLVCTHVHSNHFESTTHESESNQSAELDADVLAVAPKHKDSNTNI